MRGAAGIPIYQVDAFAERPFTGNPAAVCLLEEGRDDKWLQRVAAEMNLSETAFLIPKGDDEWRLRWFTPTVEVDLCGHATLASAHVLWETCGATAEALRFHTRSGLLTARRAGRQIALDFPADTLDPIEPEEALIASLGIDPVWVGQGRNDLLVVIESADAVRQLQPELALLATVPTRGVIVTAGSDRAEWDFVSRFFAPRAGIPEDPVTGSAHCLLGPYWGAELGKKVLTGYQASPRGGVVGMRLTGDRVQLTGSAVTVLEGRLHG